MTESYPTDATLNALSGTSDAEQGVYYPAISDKPWYTAFYKTLYRLLAATVRAGDLRAYKDGTLTFGVRAGKFLDGDTVRNYAGASAQALTNNQTNYIYVIADGTLTVNTTGFPTPSTTPHLPLATILTAAGTYAHTDVTDYRGRAFLNLCSGLSASDMAEAVAFFDATDISGAEAETLTDTSNADALHVHTLDSGVSDVTATAAQLNEAGTFFGATDISGAQAETLSDGSNADALHVHSRSGLEQDASQVYKLPLMAFRNNDGSAMGVSAAATEFGIDAADGGGFWGNGNLTLNGTPANSTTATNYTAIEVPIPPEYDDGETIIVWVRIRHNTAGSPTVDTAAIDAEIYELGLDGEPGADLNGSAEHTDVSSSWAYKSFTPNPADVVKGDKLLLVLKTTLAESGGVDAWMEIGSVEVRLDIKG